MVNNKLLNNFINKENLKLIDVKMNNSDTEEKKIDENIN